MRKMSQKNIVKMKKIDLDDNDRPFCSDYESENEKVTNSDINSKFIGESNSRVEWNVSITRPSFSIPNSNTSQHYQNVYESLIKPTTIFSQSTYDKDTSNKSTMNALLSPRMNFRSMKSLSTRQSSFASTIEDEEGLVQINQYKIRENLGGGSYGLVKLVEDNDGNLSALKIISKRKLMKSTGYFRRPPPLRNSSTASSSFCDDNIKSSVSETCSPVKSSNFTNKFGIKFVPKSFCPGNNTWISNSMNDSLRNDLYLDPLRRVYQEIAIYKKLDHPNIVKLFEVIDELDQDNLYMIFEHVEGGPVMNVGVSEPLNEDLARTYFRDIICGLEYLHFNKIIHRDIKPSNLLVDKNGIVKMIDFGVSCQFTGDDIFLQDTVGSPAFLAPECVQDCHGKFKGKALDIWALGMTLYCFLFGKVAFDSRNKIDLYHSIATKPVVLPTKPEITSEAIALLTKMLNKDPKDRIKLEEIKIHPWVTDNGKLEFQYEMQQNHQQIEVSENEIEQCTVKPVTIQTIVSALMMARRRSFKNPKRYLDPKFKLRDLVLHSEIEKRKSEENNSFLIIGDDNNHVNNENNYEKLNIISAQNLSGSFNSSDSKPIFKHVFTKMNNIDSDKNFESFEDTK